MRVLLIKPKHIGDSLLLTPTIVAIRRAHPAAKISVMVRRGCEGILAGCPEIDRFLILAPVEKRDRRASDFWREVGEVLRALPVKFDYVFELGDGHRGRLLAKLVRTRRRYSVKTASGLEGLDRWWFTAMATFEGRRCHRVEKDFHTVSEFLPLPEPIPPLRFARERTHAWEPAAPLADFAVLQMGSRQGFNLWHREGWRDVARALLDRVPHLVISCGPGEHEKKEAAWLCGELGPRALETQGKTTWAELAGLLYRARIYIGLSSASMHLAAACGCPVVGLFGPAIEDHWHPWQVPYRIVTDPAWVPSADVDERIEQARRRTTAGIRAGDVVAACDELLRSR